VLSPGDVAFTLGAGNDTTVVLNSSEWDSDNICMSVTSLVGGLVMLLGKDTDSSSCGSRFRSGSSSNRVLEFYTVLHTVNCTF
jgi:hypothetical protein